MNNKYTLPELRYEYDALEPHMSAEVLRLHHDQHHRGYVDGANQAALALEEARAAADFSALNQLERALSFNTSGHVLHSLFWQNLSPDGGGSPTGSLASAIDRDLGGLDRFHRQLVRAAMSTMGSGWGALVLDPLSGCLRVVQIHDHQSEIIQAGVPLLVLDAWEHAYYLQYRTQKERFFEAVWHLWDWEDVAERFDAAQALDLGLADTVESPSPSTPPLTPESHPTP